MKLIFLIGLGFLIAGCTLNYYDSSRTKEHHITTTTSTEESTETQMEDVELVEDEEEKLPAVPTQEEAWEISTFPSKMNN